MALLLLLSASIIPAVEVSKLVQRLLVSNETVEAFLGPASRRGR